MHPPGVCEQSSQKSAWDLTSTLIIPFSYVPILFNFLWHSPFYFFPFQFVFNSILFSTCRVLTSLTLTSALHHLYRHHTQAIVVVLASFTIFGHFISIGCLWFNDFNPSFSPFNSVSRNQLYYSINNISKIMKFLTSSDS